jgi:hypothetical protein
MIKSHLKYKSSAAKRRVKSSDIDKESDEEKAAGAKKARKGKD